jgi:hypothetical protein
LFCSRWFVPDHRDQQHHVEVAAVSREAALAQIREALTARRRAGSEIVQIAIENGSAARQTTWPRHAGTFPDDVYGYRTRMGMYTVCRRSSPPAQNPPSSVKSPPVRVSTAGWPDVPISTKAPPLLVPPPPAMTMPLLPISVCDSVFAARESALCV